MSKGMPHKCATQLCQIELIKLAKEELQNYVLYHFTFTRKIGIEM